jgi:hypothetical protein
MRDQPEGAGGQTVQVGPNTRVTFVGVALISLLVGLCVGTATIAVGLERFNRNMEDRMTHDEMTRYTIEARAAVPQLPLYLPPTKRN